MKINERTLIAYACGSGPASPVDKEGCLWKRGEVNKNFQKRYFVLKGNLLFYFDKRGDKEPVGVVILEGCTIELAEDEQEKFAFKIAFHGEGKRTYVLGTDSQVSGLELVTVLSLILNAQIRSNSVSSYSVRSRLATPRLEPQTLSYLDQYFAALEPQF